MLTVIASAIGATLYRLRGGLWRDLTGAQRWYNGTHMMRAIWFIPTAGLVMLLAPSTPWWLWFALAASIYTVTGVLHGPAYWLGWQLPGASSANGELIVGGLSWLSLVLLLR